METTMTHEYPKGVTIDDVWAALRDLTQSQKETDRMMKENAEEWEKLRKERAEQQKEAAERQKEADRVKKENDEEWEKQRKERAERQKEADRKKKENAEEWEKQRKEAAERRKEIDQQMKETDRKIKEIGNRLGDFTNSFGNVIEHLVSPDLQEKFKKLGYDFQEASTRHKIIDKKNDIRFEIDVFLQNGDTAMLVEIKSDLSISDMNRHITRLEKMRKYADLRGDKRRFLGAIAGIVIGENERGYALSQGLFLVEPSGEDYEITPPPGKPREW